MKNEESYRSIGWLIGLLMAVGTGIVMSCADNDDGEVGKSLPELGTASVLRMGDVAWEGTRAASTDNTSIELILTSKQTETPWYVQRGRVSRMADGGWQSLIEVKKDTTYYIYGFMPAEGMAKPEMTPIDGDYSKGVRLTFTDLPAVTDEDICVLIGAGRAADGAATPGHYTYTAVESNYINLLFGHVYAALDINIKVGEDYDKLRTIRLRTMQLISNIEKAALTVELRNDGSQMATATPTTTGSSSYADIKINNGEGMDLTTTAQGLAGFFAPSYPGSIRLVSMYDVYDKAGNLLRENCRAENRLPDLSGVGTGQRKVLSLTVEPTYLYVLSDPDIDSPSVTIE